MSNLQNILYLHSHDTGRYIQPYGHAIPTPNLQGLAEQGMLFYQAFCANPTCSPSRAALLTGQAAHSSGMYGLAHPPSSSRLNDYGEHIVHLLRRAGYKSYLAGHQHIIHSDNPGRDIGYDQTIGTTENAHEAAARFLRESSDKPFFLDVGFFETHRKFPELSAAENRGYCLPPAPLPNNPEVREDMCRYKASARILDNKIGVVLRALRESGKEEKTLVICTTDHGLAFPRMKCNLYDEGIGVMLLLKGAGFTGGRVSDSLVSQIDLFPTICELAGMPIPDWVQGHSLIPLASNPQAAIRSEVYAEVNYHVMYFPQRAVRTRDWKYIRNYETPWACGHNCDGSPSRDFWVRHGWLDTSSPREELYNLQFDPHEQNNLAGNVAFEQVKCDLSARLDEWMVSTDDPICTHGYVPLPPHMNVKGYKPVAAGEFVEEHTWTQT